LFRIGAVILIRVYITQGHKDRKLELEKELKVVIGKKEILLSINQPSIVTSEISTWNIQGRGSYSQH